MSRIYIFLMCSKKTCCRVFQVIKSFKFVVMLSRSCWLNIPSILLTYCCIKHIMILWLKFFVYGCNLSRFVVVILFLILFYFRFVELHLKCEPRVRLFWYNGVFLSCWCILLMNNKHCIISMAFILFLINRVYLCWII